MAYQGTSPQIGTHKKLDNLTFNGATTSFVLSSSGSPVFPAIAEALIISLNGVIQEPNGSFTVSGSNITFSAAPAIGTSFFGVLLGEKVLLADVLAASGGTMTGLLTLSANPTAALGAATKQYVDAGVSSVSTAKQDVLVSGTNIKTVNGASVLGSGDITIAQGYDSSDLIIDGEAYLNVAVGGTASEIKTVVNIDANREALIFSTTSNSIESLYIVVYNKTTKNFGTVTLLGTGSVGTVFYVQAGLISTDKLLLCSSNSQTTFSSTVISFTGSSISVGTPVLTPGDGTATLLSLQAPLIVGSAMVIKYAGTTGVPYIRAITVTGTVPSVGSALSLAYDRGRDCPMTVTSEGKILAVSGDSAGSAGVFLIELSGNTLSTLNGSFQNSGSSFTTTYDSVRLQQLSTGKYIFIWSDTNGDIKCELIDATVAGFSASSIVSISGFQNAAVITTLVVSNQIIIRASGRVTVITDNNSGTPIVGTSIPTGESETSSPAYNLGYTTSEMIISPNGSYISVGISGNNPYVSYSDMTTKMVPIGLKFLRTSTAKHVSPPRVDSPYIYVVTSGTKAKQTLGGFGLYASSYYILPNESEAWSSVHVQSSNKVFLRKIKAV
jgi:hypothetical protein